MISLRDIVLMIEEHTEKTGEKEAQLSRRVTGSPDTLRNWRRAVESGAETSATFSKVQDVLAAMGRDLVIRDNQDGISSGQEILDLLGRIKDLDPRGVELAFSVITNQIAVNQQTRSSQLASDDQSASASGRRASYPSQ